MADKRKANFVLGLVFAFVLLGMLGSTFVASHLTRRTEDLARTVSDNSGPSIEHLSGLRGGIREVEVALARHFEEPTDDVEPLRAHLDTARAELANRLREYLALPIQPGEEVHVSAVERSILRLDARVAEIMALLEAGQLVEAERRHRRLHAVGDEAANAVWAATEFNAEQGRQAARDIQRIRRRAIGLTYAMDVACLLAAFGGVVILRRLARIREAMQEQQARQLAIRASELEQFAGRVAHDIRNPLTTIRTGAELLNRTVTDPRQRDVVARVIRAVGRAADITEGLLEFARSGAQPDPGARADVASVIDDVVTAVRDDAQNADITITEESIPRVLVACSTGVYLSLLTNLVRNAVKYMGESTTRRVTVRVRVDGPVVVTEVEDTGPGIPDDVQESIFKPYFRAATERQSGMGLGLATVMRLAEGHGGSAGVRSEVGRGSLFWFTLPIAGRADDVVGSALARGGSLRRSRDGGAELPH